MKIAYISDIHYDMFNNVDVGNFYEYHWDVLVVAGDVGNAAHFEHLLTELADDFPDRVIISVLGNHEHYLSGIPVRTLERELDNLDFAIYENVFVLSQGEYVIIKDVCFIGATLWTDLGHHVSDTLGSGVMNHVAPRISDFSMINLGAFTPNNAYDLYVEDRQDIMSSLEANKDYTTVVVTHFSPSLEYRNTDYPLDMMTYYFTGYMEDVIHEYSPTYWISGHSHANNGDMKLGNTTLVSNQMHNSTPKLKFIEI